jgi:hypothetical protein
MRLLDDREEAAWRAVWWLAMALSLAAWAGVIATMVLACEPAYRYLGGDPNSQDSWQPVRNTGGEDGAPPPDFPVPQIKE